MATLAVMILFPMLVGVSCAESAHVCYYRTRGGCAEPPRGCVHMPEATCIAWPDCDTTHLCWGAADSNATHVHVALFSADSTCAGEPDLVVHMKPWQCTNVNVTAPDGETTEFTALAGLSPSCLPGPPAPTAAATSGAYTVQATDFSVLVVCITVVTVVVLWCRAR